MMKIISLKLRAKRRNVQRKKACINVKQQEIQDATCIT